MWGRWSVGRWVGRSSTSICYFIISSYTDLIYSSSLYVRNSDENKAIRVAKCGCWNHSGADHWYAETSGSYLSLDNCRADCRRQSSRPFNSVAQLGFRTVSIIPDFCVYRSNVVLFSCCACAYRIASLISIGLYNVSVLLINFGWLLINFEILEQKW